MLRESVFDYLIEHVNATPDKVAVITDQDGKSLTYQELLHEIKLYVECFKRIGIEKGTKVSVKLSNRMDIVVTWFALLDIGAINVLVNTNYKKEEEEYIVQNSKSEFYIYEKNSQIFIKTNIKSYELEKVMNNRQDIKGEYIFEKKFSGSIQNIQYTSGTTGKPKGCLLSHKYWLILGNQYLKEPVKLNKEDIILSSQPFYYMDPQFSLTTAIMAGGTFVLLDRFHPSTFMDKLVAYKVTFFVSVGVMPAMLLNVEKKFDKEKSKLRYVACADIPKESHKEINDLFGVVWAEIYGMTEIGGVTFIPNDLKEELVGTNCIGRIDDYKEILIVNDNYERVDRGEVGQLLVRGIGVMDGYYNSVGNESYLEGGWFKTGDSVKQDSRGLLYFMGRQKDIIRRSGENISAKEVENILNNYSEIEISAVVPVDDKIRGEEVKAYLVLKESVSKDQGLLITNIINYLGGKFSYFKIPRYFEFVDSFPKTASERIIKSEIKGNKIHYDKVYEEWVNYE